MAEARCAQSGARTCIAVGQRQAADAAARLGELLDPGPLITL